MNDLKLSVIIPVYNAAPYLPGMLEALVRQTDSRFEAVFVNDGSTDESLAVLRRAQAELELNIRVIDRENGGASAARNSGISAAQGELITFADADDTISEKFAEDIIANAVKGGAAVFRHSRVVDDAVRFDKCDGSIKNLEPEEAMRALMLNPTRFGVYDLAIDRAFLLDSGVRFQEGWPYYEDYDFILRLFNACGDISAVERCNYCYRATPGSAMNVFNEERLRCLQLFDNIHSLYCSHRIEFYDDFLKWFSARLRWSVIWQACVHMPIRDALKFAAGAENRRAMRSLTDYPDRRIALSAAVFTICPPVFAIIMRRMGKRRTLLPENQ